MSKYELNNLGEAYHLLAMEVHRMSNMIMMSHTAFIIKILEKFEMDQSKAMMTPRVFDDSPPKPIEPYGPEVNRDDIPYHEIVGSLQYLVHCIRPDLAEAVRELSMYLNCYTAEHFVMAKLATAISEP